MRKSSIISNLAAAFEPQYSRPYPRYGLKENDNDKHHCIYMFAKPQHLPRGYVEHKVSKKELE
ncbi:hypothetical protein AAVH_13526, partial [Aphelenchoides avenae]